MSWTHDIKSSHDYYEHVEDSAREMVKYSGLMPNDSDIYDTVHEWTDNSVIYYTDCANILHFSANNNAAFEEMGPECIEGKTSVSEVNTVLAYFAYSRDLSTALTQIEEDEAHELLKHVQCEECDSWHENETEAQECCAEEDEEGE